MKRKALALTLLTAAWLAGLTFTARSALDRLEIESWGNPMSDSVSAPVAGTSHVGQLFTAPMPGLYRIEVSLVPGDGAAARPIVFHLQADPSANEDLVTLEASTADIEGGTPLGFEFEPVRTSKDQRFFFYLESPQSEPGQAPLVSYSPAAGLEGANAYLDGRPLPGSLTFHTYYNLRTRDRLGLFLSRMTEGQPHLTGNKAFYLVLAAAYALALVAFLYRVGDQVVTESDRGS